MMAERFRKDADKFAVAPRSDVAALPDLLHGQPRAVSARDRRPVYVRAGGHEQAWRQRVASRVAHHQCESVCDRAHLGAPVSIHAVERFLAEGWATQERADYVSAVREANSGAYGSH